MEPRLTLVTLGVSDLSRARRFYEALGWRSPCEPESDVVFFPSGGMVLALWGREQLAEDSVVADTGGWGGVTLAYNVGSPEEVDRAIEEARAAGATSPAPAVQPAPSPGAARRCHRESEIAAHELPLPFIRAPRDATKCLSESPRRTPAIRR